MIRLVLTGLLLVSCSQSENSSLVSGGSSSSIVSNSLSINSLDSINSDNQASYPISGNCENQSSQLEFAFNSDNLLFTINCENFEFSEMLDLSSLSDSTSIELEISEGSSSSINSSLIKDTSSPSISSESITDDSYSLGEEIQLNITFDESVIVSDNPQIEIQLDSQSQADIYFSYLSGSGSNQLVFSYTVANGDNDLTSLSLDTKMNLTNGNIADSNGNNIDPNLSTVNFPNVLIDTDLPTITSVVNPVNGTYAHGGGEITFQINFSESVTVTGSPRIAIDIGADLKYATYVSGSGTTGLEFSYPIESGDEDTDGISFNSTLIDLNNGSIESSADQDSSDLNFSSYASSMSAVLIDTSSGITAPNQVTGVTTAPTTSNTALALSWERPDNNGTGIINYQLQYRESGASTWTTSSASKTTSTTVNGLTAGITYEFRVAANNGLLGPYSDTTVVEIFDILSLNPIAWLSSTNISNGGTEPTNGDKVSAWSDLTGTATDATESNSSKQPTYETNVQNGLPAVKFDGTIDRGLEGSFTRTNNGGLTIFVVGKFSGTARRAFFEFYQTGGGTNPGSPRGFFFTYGFNNASVNYNLDNTQFNVWSAYDTGSNTDFWENGNLVYSNFGNWGNTSFTGSGSYVLGDDQTGGDKLNGYIGEFLIFDKELTADEKTTIETYLKNKWGTP